MAEAINEPANSTVNDWLGQTVDEDEEVADEAMAESGSNPEEAECKFAERAQGKERFQAGYPRPDDGAS